MGACCGEVCECYLGAAEAGFVGVCVEVLGARLD